MSAPPFEWCDVLEGEYRALSGAPPGESGAPADAAARLRAVHQRLHARAPTALCLSGGGIRSATFALGVLQGLAHLRVLGTFDYLSTVSGGGYIGAWLTAWLHREGASGRGSVFDTLDPARPHALEATPIDRLRRTCRYLAPAGGLISADMWTLIVTLARNLILNWLVLLPLLAALLLIPRVYFGVMTDVEQPLTTTRCDTPLSIGFAATAIAGIVIASIYVVLNFAGRAGTWSQGRFLAAFLLPTVTAAIALSLFWAAYPCELQAWHAIVPSAVIPAASWFLIGNAGRLVWGRAPENDGSALLVRPGLHTTLAAAAAGPILGGGIYWLTTYPFGFGSDLAAREFFAVFAVPIVLGLVLLQMLVFVGIASSELDDAALEWWSRAGAWLAIAAVVWLTAGVLVFYMADLVEWSLLALSASADVDHDKTRGMFLVLVPLLASLAGLAARPRGTNAGPSRLLALVHRVALPLIIVVLLSAIAWTNMHLAALLEYHVPAPHPPGNGLGEVLLLGAGLTALALVMSRFVPANRFSLHGMYRQRLIRTFLGASRSDRHANAFTGFDGHDDVCVHDLADVRPLHVINATLNAVSSTHVGRHQRQAESFTFTPLHVGNRQVGYRPAGQFGSDGGGRGSGLSLGMAMAVSGAAASPAMGIYSSKSLAFLLTLANARLGLWFGNPRDDATWRNSDPPLGIGPVARELFGLTTDHNPYVYLSDGGHYDNLGVWEMVARRCHAIVISDAGCDPSYTFDDLSNAVRRIRLDLGVPIQFHGLDMTRAGQGTTNHHAAVGVVRYSAVDGPAARDGIILYLKATLSGDEPVDVLNFARRDPAFPHDSTADQFFDEARFESYRMLGFHTVMSVAHHFEGGGAAALCAGVARDLAQRAPHFSGTSAALPTVPSA